MRARRRPGSRWPRRHPLRATEPVKAIQTSCRAKPPPAIRGRQDAAIYPKRIIRLGLLESKMGTHRVLADSLARRRPDGFSCRSDGWVESCGRKLSGIE